MNYDIKLRQNFSELIALLCFQFRLSEILSFQYTKLELNAPRQK